MRTIKKYDNRCLYDCELSTNISLDDLKQYVSEGIKFKVINAKSEDDITRQYLIQIILDLDTAGTHLFTQTALEQIIRFYTAPQQSYMQEYLEQTLTIMAKQQQMFAEMWKGNK